MKKNFKSMLCFLFALVFVLQFAGAMPTTASADGLAETATVSYQVWAVKGTDTDSTDITDDQTLVLGEGKTVKVDFGEDVTSPTLASLRSNGFSITPPDGYFVESVFIVAGGSKVAEDAKSLTQLAAAALDSTAVTFDKAIFAADYTNVDFDSAIIHGTTGDTLTIIINIGKLTVVDNTTYSITYAPGTLTTLSDALVENGNAFSVSAGSSHQVLSILTAQRDKVAKDSTKAFDGWKLVYGNGSSLSVAAGDAVTPYANCEIVAQWADAVVVTAKDLTKPYDGTALKPALDSYTIVGLPEGYTAAVTLSGEITNYSDTAAVNKVESVVITDAESNTVETFKVITFNGSLSITKAPLTITAKDPVAGTDGSYVSNGYTASALVGSDAIDSVQLTVAASDGKYISTPSAAVIKNGETDVTANYNISYVASGAVTPPAAPIELTITAKAPVYDETGKTYKENGYDISSGTLAVGDTISSVTYLVTNTDGKYYSTPTAAVIKNGETDVTNKYKLTFTASDPTTPPVERGAITIKAKDRTATYNGTLITANDYEITSGTLADGDKVDSVTYDGGSTNATSTAVDSKPTVVIKDSAGKVVTDSYKITYAAGKVTVNKFDVTITAASKEMTYSGSTFAATDVQKATASGKANSGDVITAAFEIRQNGTKVSSPTAVGTYANVITKATVKNSTGDDITSNYNIKLVDGTLTIKASEKAIALTVTAKSQSWTYDGSAHTCTEYTVTGLVGGDQINKVTFDSASTITNAGTKDNIIKSVAITNNGTAVDSAKYSITYVKGTLTVNKFPLTITAESASKTYDGKALENKNVSAGKLANTNHKLSVEYGVYDSKGNKIQNGAIEPGTYTKKITKYTILDGTTDVTANYDVKTVDGTLTIKSSDKNNSTSPKTGDDNNITLWIILLAASAVLVAAVVIYVVIKNKKKKENSDEEIDSGDDNDGSNE